MSKPLFNTAVDAATAARLFAKSTMDAAAGETSTAIGDIVSLPTESISLVSQRLAVQVALVNSAIVEWSRCALSHYAFKTAAEFTSDNAEMKAALEREMCTHQGAVNRAKETAAMHAASLLSVANDILGLRVSTKNMDIVHRREAFAVTLTVHPPESGEDDSLVLVNKENQEAYTVSVSSFLKQADDVGSVAFTGREKTYHLISPSVELVYLWIDANRPPAKP